MNADTATSRDGQSEVPIVSSQSKQPSDALVLVCWLVVQLIALSITVSQVPLWARFAQPTENLAFEIMLVTQVAFAAMLLPNLVYTWRAAVAVIASTLPFGQLAGLLSAKSAPSVALASVCVAGWIGTLVLLSAAVRTRSARCVISALATAVSLGGAVLLLVRN